MNKNTQAQLPVDDKSIKPRSNNASESLSTYTTSNYAHSTIISSRSPSTHRNTITASSPQSPENWNSSICTDNEGAQNNKNSSLKSHRRYSCPNTGQLPNTPRIQLNNETIQASNRNSYLASFPIDPYDELAPFDHKLDDIQEHIQTIKQKNKIAKKNIKTFKNIANKVGQLSAILVFISLILAIDGSWIPENALGDPKSLEYKFNVAMIIAFILFISILETRQYTKRAFGVDNVIGTFETCSQENSMDKKNAKDDIFKNSKLDHRKQKYDEHANDDDNIDEGDEAATKLLSPKTIINFLTPKKVEFDYKPVFLEVSKSVVYITAAIKLIEVYHANPKNNESSFSVIGLLGFMAAMMCGSLHIGLGLGLYFLEKDTVDMKSKLLETQMCVEMKRQETIKKRPDLFMTAAHVKRQNNGQMLSAKVRLGLVDRNESLGDEMGTNHSTGARFNLVPFMVEKK